MNCMNCNHSIAKEMWLVCSQINAITFMLNDIISLNAHFKLHRFTAEYEYVARI